MAKEKQEKRVVVEQKHTKKMEQNWKTEQQKRELVEQDLLHLEKEILMHKKAAHAQDRDMDKLEREKQVERKGREKADGATKVALDEVKANERIAKNLETEVVAYKQEAAKQRKLIYQLEKDREKYGIEASEQRALYLQALEDAKLTETRLSELQKQVLGGDQKLKQQQQLYEAVRSDRNLFSKI